MHKSSLPNNAFEQCEHLSNAKTLLITKKAVFQSCKLAVSVVFLLGACSKPAVIEDVCSANGMGETSCEFSNKGETEGSKCVYVVLKRSDSAEQMVSREICSGIVKAGDVIQRETSGGFEQSPSDFCRGDYDSDWTENCSLGTASDLADVWKTSDVTQ